MKKAPDRVEIFDILLPLLLGMKIVVVLGLGNRRSANYRFVSCFVFEINNAY